MIKHFILVCSLIGLSACGTTKTIYIQEAPPALPPLDSKVTEECPPLALLIDKSIGAIATEDANSAYQYAQCQVKHRSVVNIYEIARQARDKYLAELKQKQDEQNASSQKK